MEGTVLSSASTAPVYRRSLTLPPLADGRGSPPADENWLKRAAEALNRHPRTCLLLLAALFALQVSPDWYPTPDASSYLSIARSIAHGTGPSNLGSRQLYVAPGYPLLISPAFLLGDRPFLPLSVLHWCLALALSLGVYRWARRTVPDAAVLITAVAMVNVDLWALYRRTLSETAFMTGLVWAATALAWSCRASSTRQLAVRILLAASLVCFLVAIRQAGLMLAAGFGSALLIAAFRQRISWRRAAAQALAVGLPAAAVLVGLAGYDRLMAASSGAPTYVDQIADPTTTLSAQVLEGFRLRVSEIGRLTVPGMFKSYGRRGEWLNVNMAVFLPLSGFVLAGWWKLVGRTGDPLALTFPFYLALYIIWPFDQATRFMVPMLPLLAACLWHVLEPLQRFRAPLVLVGLLAHGVIAAGYWLGVDCPRARALRALWPDLIQVAASIPGDAGSVACSGVPPDSPWIFQLILDRRVADLRPEGFPSDAAEWLVTPSGTRPGNRYGFHAGTERLSVWKARADGRRRIQCGENRPIFNLTHGARARRIKNPLLNVSHGSGREKGLTSAAAELTVVGSSRET